MRPQTVPIVEARNLCKNFRLYHEKRNTLYENIAGFFSGQKSFEDFAALKNVSFDVQKGETLGIIGGNGSGKSTLLKVIANILRPDKGVVHVRGRITPFLELGVGFQENLTAVENIEVYGAILGFSPGEMRRRTEEILDFAELQKFRDTKIKNFSSGMYVRLAFSTAIQCDPEILLVDEVLAVGDMAFQQKCFDVFNKYRNEGKTILLVTHDLSAVRRFCDKTLLMRNGEVAAFGPADEVIDAYVYEAKKISEAKETAGERWGNKKVQICGIKFFDKFGKENDTFNTGDSMIVRIFYEARGRVEKPVFGVAIHSEQGIHCFGTNTSESGYGISSITGAGHIDFIVDRIIMNQGTYFLTVAIHALDHTHYDWRNKEFKFNIVRTTNMDGLFEMPVKWDKHAQ